MARMNALIRFAKSRQGKKLAAAALMYAQSPRGRKQIAQARQQVAKRRKPR